MTTYDSASRSKKYFMEIGLLRQPSLGALHSRNSRATKKKITATELDLTRLQVEHGQLYSKHKTSGQENAKLQRQLTKSLADV